jgi:hypothetical protein
MLRMASDGLIRLPRPTGETATAQTGPWRLPRIPRRTLPSRAHTVSLNTCRATDITYIRLRRGFFYLAAVMDWYSRCVLSWEASISLDPAFCVAALGRAVEAAVQEISSRAIRAASSPAKLSWGSCKERKSASACSRPCVLDALKDPNEGKMKVFTLSTELASPFPYPSPSLQLLSPSISRNSVLTLGSTSTHDNGTVVLGTV